MSDILKVICGLQTHIRNYLENNLFDEQLNEKVNRLQYSNPWFTPYFVKKRLQAISTVDAKLWEVMMQNAEDNIVSVWVDERVPLDAISVVWQLMLTQKQVVYRANNNTDKVFEYLMLLLPNNLVRFESNPNKAASAFVIDQKDVNNSLKKYLEHRKNLIINQRGVAVVLSGNETSHQLAHLASGIFDYYGQGKYSVRKVFVPEGYEIRQLYSYFEPYAEYANHNSWANNYQYNQSVYLMNLLPFFDNGFLILKEDKTLIAPTGVLFYEYYTHKTELINKISANGEYVNICNMSEIIIPRGLSMYDYLSLQPISELRKFISSL
jgi:hypothetical protein